MKKFRWTYLTFIIASFTFIAFENPLWKSLINGNGDPLNVLINTLVFVLCTVLYIITWIKIGIVDKISLDLRNSSNHIKENNNSDKILNNSVIHETYCDYLRAIDNYNDTSNNKHKPNIENYISYGLIDSQIEKDVLNNFSGIMTGLGILGTFLGLSLGLSNFSTGSAADIMESLEPLMGGIKVAFHTSVYGMIFSLGFGLDYKKTLSKAYDCVDEFLNTYKKHIEIDTKDNAIIETQSILENIPISIADNLSGHFEKFSDVLNKTLQFMADKQDDNLKSLTDEFIKQLSEQTSEQFKKLGELLDKNCELQEQSNTHLAEVLERNEKMLGEIKEIELLVTKTIDESREYIEDVEKLQEEINKVYTGVTEESNHLEERKSNMIAEIDSYREKCNTEIAESRQVLNNEVEAVKLFVDESVKKIEEVNNNLDNANENMKGTAEQLTEVSKSLIQYTDGIKEIPIEMQKSTQEITEKFKTTCDEMMVDIRFANDEYIEKHKEASMQVISALEESKDCIKQEAENIGYSLKDSASKIDYACQNFDSKVEEYTDRTFKKFDDELANIESHLAGTIAAIQDSTEHVNAAVNSVSDSMEKIGRNEIVRLEKLKELSDEQIEAINRYTKMIKKEA